MNEEVFNKLKERIERLKGLFRQGLFENEASVSRQAVDPILRDLGWPTDDNNIVKYEYPLKAMRADIALFHENELKVVMEVKKPGFAEGADEQLFQYTYHAGVELAVLTTGQLWEVYLPMKPGNYLERQVYKLDIIARETEESAKRLMRYLSYQDTCSGECVKAAEADHKDKKRDREIMATLPKAWNKILVECDHSLIELLQDKVGDICGYKPAPDVVTKFIGEQAGFVKEQTGSDKHRSTPTVVSVQQKPVGSRPAKQEKSTRLVGFWLYGKKYDRDNGINTLIGVFDELIKRDATFPDEFMKISHGRSRRWMANNRSELYPGRPDLCRDWAQRLTSGHLISTNHSTGVIKTIIERACSVAGIKYGSELKLYHS